MYKMNQNIVQKSFFLNCGCLYSTPAPDICYFKEDAAASYRGNVNFTSLGACYPWEHHYYAAEGYNEPYRYVLDPNHGQCRGLTTLSVPYCRRSGQLFDFVECNIKICGVYYQHFITYTWLSYYLIKIWCILIL